MAVPVLELNPALKKSHLPCMPAFGALDVGIFNKCIMYFRTLLSC